jgi:hypothetical protein
MLLRREIGGIVAREIEMGWRMREMMGMMLGIGWRI